jgi:hypothetical protein
VGVMKTFACRMCACMDAHLTVELCCSTAGFITEK